MYIYARSHSVILCDLLDGACVRSFCYSLLLGKHTVFSPVCFSTGREFHRDEDGDQKFPCRIFHLYRSPPFEGVRLNFFSTVDAFESLHPILGGLDMFVSSLVQLWGHFGFFGTFLADK